MATMGQRELKVGIIIDKTLGVVEHTARASLIYAGVVTVVNVALTYYTVDMIAPKQQLVLFLVKFLISAIAAYLLLEAMVRSTGLRTREGDAVFFPYLGLTALYTLGVIVGFILIIFPGLLVMARWSIAGPMLVARGDKATRALGESWELTRGNEFSIIAAALVILALLIGVTIACSVMFDKANIIGIVIAQVTASVMGMLQLGMGVALYGLIVGKAPASTFE